MGYIEGSLTSANPAADLCEIIKDELIAEGGVFVESYSANSNTIQVMRIPAASNPLNQEWFLVLWYTTASQTIIKAFAAEGYDSANKLFIRGTFSTTSSYAPSGVTGSRYGNTGQAYSSWSAWDINVRTSAFNYGFNVSGSALVGSTAASRPGYLGLMNPSQAVIDGNSGDGYYPLAILPWGNTGTARATSRLIAGLSGNLAWGDSVLGRALYSNVSRSIATDRINGVSGVPYAVGPSSTAVSAIPDYMGTLYNCLYMTYSNTNSVSSGDRLICNGKVYSVPYTSSTLSGESVLILVGNA